jgi:anti-sigma factor RsiW
VQPLLHGYVDGELDLVKNLEIEQHLQGCPACAQKQAQLQALRATIQTGAPYWKPPPGLQRRVQVAVRRAAKGRAGRRPLPRHWLALAASLMFIVGGGWGLASLLAPRPAEETLTRELVSSHVRSQLLAEREAVDVKSSDQHVVKPWFQGKLDFAPWVRDLKGQGFPLIGGRLDYLDNRPVAALVYKRNKHYINLFIWPSNQGDDLTLRAMTRQGFRLVHWTQGGMNYWAVSDLEVGELQEFARVVREQIPP